MTPPRRETSESSSALAIHLDSKIDQLRAEIVALVAANDVRYQQRFDAQGKALDAAFGAAKEAVNAALAASDKAAVKTELSADKRFADLGDLIREQFRGMSDKFENLAGRISRVEDRMNTASGETAGGRHVIEEARHTSIDTRGLWAIVIAVVMGVLSLLSFMFRK